MDCRRSSPSGMSTERLMPYLQQRRGQIPDRGGEPCVAERGRVASTRHRPEGPHPQSCLGCRVAERDRGGRFPTLECLGAGGQGQRQPGELLYGTVVEVGRDAAAFDIARFDRPREQLLALLLPATDPVCESVARAGSAARSVRARLEPAPGGRHATARGRSSGWSLSVGTPGTRDGGGRGSPEVASPRGACLGLVRSGSGATTDRLGWPRRRRYSTHAERPYRADTSSRS